MRAAFPDLQLQVDANSAYTLETAAALLPLDALDLLLIEQPLAEDDLWDHSRLQRQFQTAICLDESILSVQHARQALEMGVLPNYQYQAWSRGRAPRRAAHP